MPWINFGRWCNAAGKVFFSRRVYLGHRWTPFVIIKLR